MLRVKGKSIVVAIYVAAPCGPIPPIAGGHPDVNMMVSVQDVVAEQGMGLVGDRWHGVLALQQRDGRLVPTDHIRNVSVFEWEKVLELQEMGFAIQPEDLRRNILVKNFALNDLVGKTFQIGEVTLKATRLSHGCDRIEKLLKIEGINKALFNRGGVRAEVVKSGTIHIGDELK